MRDVMFAEFRCGIEITDTECWSSAAAPIFYKRNLEPERFQDSHRSDADMRFVIAHKGVVPEDDMAALLLYRPSTCYAVPQLRRRRMSALRRSRTAAAVFRKPFVEAFACVMW